MTSNRIFRDDEGTPEPETGPGTLFRPDEGPAAPAEATQESPGRDVPGLFPEPPAPAPTGPGLFRPDEGRSRRPAPPSPARPRPRLAPAPPLRRRRWRSRSYVWTTVALFAGLLILDGIYVGLRLGTSLVASAEAFDRARGALQDGRLAEATTELATARDGAHRAARLTRHPAPTLLGLLPAIGSDARAVAGIARAAELAALGGLEASDAIDAVGAVEGDLAASLYEEQRVELELIEAARPSAIAADTYFSQAQAILAGLDRPSFPSVVDALTKTSAEIGELARAVHRGRVLSEFVPLFLGEDRTRNYLLVVQALGEARGSGGLVGVVGLLTAQDGDLDLAGVAPVLEVFPFRYDDPVFAPPWFVASYGSQGALHQTQQANVSPNFPIAADILAQMFERTTGLGVDGVVAVDAVSFGQVLEATGAVRPAVDGELVTPEQAADKLLIDSYLEFDTEEAQNDFFAQLIRAFWRKIEAEEFDFIRLARSVGEAARTRHLQIYMVHGPEEDAMHDLGVSGDYAAPGPNPQLVFHNSYGANKVDVYLKRRINTRVELFPDGDAVVRTTVRMTNEAPGDPPSLLLGRPGDKAVGTNRMLLSLLLPEGAGLDSFRIDGRLASSFAYSDESHPVAWRLLDIAPGDSVTVTVTYTVPGAFRSFADGASAAVTLVPHAAANPDSYSVRVLAPEGYAFSGPGGELIGEFTASGTLTGPVVAGGRLYPL